MTRIGPPIMSGHCNFPQTADPLKSHDRCHDNGAGVTTRIGEGTFHPCPCTCHVGEEFECSECGDSIYEAPNLGPDEDGDMQYVHISEDGLRVTGVYCP